MQLFEAQAGFMPATEEDFAVTDETVGTAAACEDRANSEPSSAADDDAFGSRTTEVVRVDAKHT